MDQSSRGIKAKEQASLLAGMKHPFAEQWKACSPISLPFDQFQLGEGLDLVLIAGYLIAQAGMQPHQFAIRGDLLAGHIARPRFPTQQHLGNGHGIEPIGLGTQSLLPVKLMRLARMQQTELITAPLGLLIQILSRLGR